MAAMDLNRALIPGMAGTSVDQQITLALAYWNNVVGNSVDDLDNTKADAAAAIALLTAEQARIRNPAT